MYLHGPPLNVQYVLHHGTRHHHITRHLKLAYSYSPIPPSIIFSRLNEDWENHTLDLLHKKLDRHRFCREWLAGS